MGLTSDRNDPRLTHGSDDAPIGGQADVYLVLSDEERAKGFDLRQGVGDRAAERGGGGRQ